MIDLKTQALLFAVNAHSGQFRKDDVTPYVTHPIRVAYLTNLAYDTSENTIAAAYLHDVMEDCPHVDITKEFPEGVVDIVELLTKKDGMSKLDAVDQVRYDVRACIIKMADRLDNITDRNVFGKEYKTRRSVIKSTKRLLHIAEDFALTDVILYRLLVSELLSIGVHYEQR